MINISRVHRVCQHFVIAEYDPGTILYYTSQTVSYENSRWRYGRSGIFRHIFQVNQERKYYARNQKLFQPEFS